MRLRGVGGWDCAISESDDKLIVTKRMRPRSRKYKRVQADPCEDLLSLQKKLLQVWEKQDVDEYYQNLLLNYMDSLPEEQALALITREIRASH